MTVLGMYLYQIADLTPLTIKIFLVFLSKMPEFLGIVPTNQSSNSKIKQFKSLCHWNLWWY